MGKPEGRVVTSSGIIGLACMIFITSGVEASDQRDDRIAALSLIFNQRSRIIGGARAGIGRFTD